MAKAKEWKRKCYGCSRIVKTGQGEMHGSPRHPSQKHLFCPSCVRDYSHK